MEMNPCASGRSHKLSIAASIGPSQVFSDHVSIIILLMLYANHHAFVGIDSKFEFKSIVIMSVSIVRKLALVSGHRPTTPIHTAWIVAIHEPYGIRYSVHSATGQQNLCEVLLTFRNYEENGKVPICDNKGHDAVKGVRQGRSP